MTCPFFNIAIPIAEATFTRFQQVLLPLGQVLERIENLQSRPAKILVISGHDGEAVAAMKLSSTGIG